MTRACNIDSRGRLARFLYGLLLTVTGITLAFTWAWPSGGWLAWTVVVVIVAMGLFAIYEGFRGWCVMRAMGFRTPM